MALIVPTQLGEDSEWRPSRALRTWMNAVSKVINAGDGNGEIVTPINMGRGQLPAATGILYTAPSGQGAQTPRVVLKRLILANRTAGGARTLSIYIVESGGTANAARAILQDQVIPDGVTWFLEFDDVLDAGETIQGKCDAADIITYRISGEQHQ